MADLNSPLNSTFTELYLSEKNEVFRYHIEVEFPDDIFTYESFEIKDVLKPELEPVTVEGDPTTVDAVFYLKENGDNSSYTAVEDQEARDLFAPFVYQAATNTVSTKVTKHFMRTPFWKAIH